MVCFSCVHDAGDRMTERQTLTEADFDQFVNVE